MMKTTTPPRGKQSEQAIRIFTLACCSLEQTTKNRTEKQNWSQTQSNAEKPKIVLSPNSYVYLNISTMLFSNHWNRNINTVGNKEIRNAPEWKTEKSYVKTDEHEHLRTNA